MRRCVLVVVSLVLVLLVSAGAIDGASTGDGRPDRSYVPGEVLIKLAPGVDGAERAQLQSRLGATTLAVFRSNAERWRLGAAVSVEHAIAQLRGNPHVRYVEPNYIVSADATPSDPRLGDLWGLINTGQSNGTPDADIDADLAWDVSVGSVGVIVGIIDTGVDYSHPDLAGNIWTNPGEIPGNGLDDDGNGFIDDVHGYDFVNEDGEPFDDGGHGTHLAGTIGAVGNNGIGVVGVNWTVRIMALKFLNASGTGTTADAIRALDYAVQMGVGVTNNSYGSSSFSQALYDAIAHAGAHEMAFVASAGGSQHDNDLYPQYPASYDLPNIIAVAGTDRNDLKLASSNWGPVSVDLGAPGGDILSTKPGASYQLMSGSSMATAHVSGACALVRAVAPGIPVAALKSRLLDSVDLIPSMDGLVASNGRLNVFRALGPPDATPPGMIEDLAAFDPGSDTMGLSWTAPGNDGHVGVASYYDVRYSLSPIDEANWPAATRAGGEPAPLVAGSFQTMEVLGLAADTLYYFAIKAFDEWGNAAPISNLAAARTLPPPVVGVAPPSIVTALPPAAARTRTLTIRNTGASTLDWSAGANILSAIENVAANEPLELQKDEEDPRVGTLGSGGPDRFGYRWRDSDSAGGPVFDWFDIDAVGTPITFGSYDDANSGPIPIGFPFPFYGNSFTDLRVCTNGWLSFTNTTTDLSNDPLPSTSSPENLLAVFHDDLHFRGVQRAKYYNDGGRLIVQYTDVDKYSPSGAHLTFQVILDPTGRIVYQYLTMSGTLNSATIGIQNGARNDGLTVAYNTNYVHDNLAVEFEKIPEWVTLGPTSGTVPAGGSQEVTVTLDSTGLAEGLHESTIHVESNDPATPSVQVPVRLNVGLIAPTWTEFDPEVLNLRSNGKFVTMTVELPPDLDPQLIRRSSVMLNDAVPAVESPPPEFGDRDHDQVVDVAFKFDRLAVESILPEGQEVPVSIQGEVEDVQWWRGVDTVRTMRPRITAPAPGSYFLSAAPAAIRWEAPIAGAPTHYDVQLSRNGGATWEMIASSVTGTGYDWMAGGEITSDAVVRVLAFDGAGLMGFDTSDGPFTIAGEVLLPPNSLDGATLSVERLGADLQLSWKSPAVDPSHGPADRYRVLRGPDPAATLAEVAVVTGDTLWTEPLAATEGVSVFYRVVAENAAGPAE